MIVRVLLAAGAALLLAAAWYGVQNYRATRHISNYWLFFSIAMIAGGGVWTLSLVEITEGRKLPVSDVRQPLIIVFFTLLVSAGIARLTTDIGDTMDWPDTP